MKRRTRLGRIPSMKQEPTDTLGALFGPHMHNSSQEVLALLRKVEWRGDNVNHHGYRGFCPSCGNNQATGHRTDCELNKVLTGPGPRIAGHLVEQNQRLERKLKALLEPGQKIPCIACFGSGYKHFGSDSGIACSVCNGSGVVHLVFETGTCPRCGGDSLDGHKKGCELGQALKGIGSVALAHLAETVRQVKMQNAALQRHNTEQVELRRSAELELRQANLCLDCNRAEVSKLSSLVNEHLDRGRRLQNELSQALKNENMVERDLGEVLEWSKGLYDLARHGMFLLAGHLEIYRSPVYPDPASLYDELHKHMTKDVAARVALHPLTNTAEKAKST